MQFCQSDKICTGDIPIQMKGATTLFNVYVDAMRHTHLQETGNMHALVPG